MEFTFTNIYKNNRWGDNKQEKYKGSSGEGSKVDYNNDIYVPFLKKNIKEYDVKNIVDLGCGDFLCGLSIYDDLDISYTGYDAYKEIIDSHLINYASQKYSFIHLDFYSYKEDIITGDLCILKDVLQHWPLNNIYSFLDYLVENKKFKYILICNCCNQKKDDTDVQIGDCRPLSSDFFPLKKYNAKKLYNYKTKEVSIIEIL